MISVRKADVLDYAEGRRPVDDMASMQVTTYPRHGLRRGVSRV